MISPAATLKAKVTFEANVVHLPGSVPIVPFERRWSNPPQFRNGITRGHKRLLVPIWDYARFVSVRIIALSTLKAFISRSTMYADAREPVMAWYRQVRGADWATPADVKRAIRSASILKDGRAVFNIAGNEYRIVVWNNYPYRVVYVRFIGTHRQYDRIDAQTV